jgi:rod shape-determining protein MreC
LKQTNYFFSLKICLLVLFLLIIFSQKKYENYLVNNVYSYFWHISSSLNESISSINNYFTKQSFLIKKTQDLLDENSILRAKIYRLYSLQSQNKQLRKLLSSSANLGGDYLVAQLLMVFKNSDSINIAINKGASSSIYEGQPVLDGYGVIGQVIKVFDKVSIVQFITDSNSAVPVVIKSKGLRGVAKGIGNSKYLELVDINNKQDIAVGDVLFTSGLGLQFVPGYPVGVIYTIKDETVLIKPLAHLSKSNHYLLIWPENSRWLEILDSKNKDSHD